jgi:hypothetical protein
MQETPFSHRLSIGQGSADHSVQPYSFEAQTLFAILSGENGGLGVWNV